ncbi:MAG: hypothetical protein FWF59_10310 [Turicibacter sp.]|nr:hypothetical protein [Turicibacter sp.]
MAIQGKKPTAIQVVYHIAAMGDWENIVRQQARLLSASGLGDACAGLHIIVVGHASLGQVARHFRHYPYFHKTRLEHGGGLGEYERPAIKKVQQLARANPRFKILYFHTKGASYKEKYRQWPQVQKNLAQWRDFMEYFCIQKWQECVQKLNGYDICGVEWATSAALPGVWYFSGNFWWATGSYLNRCSLESPIIAPLPPRYRCEGFIGTGHPSVCNLRMAANEQLRAHYGEVKFREMAWEVTGGVFLFKFGEYYLDPIFYRGER